MPYDIKSLSSNKKELKTQKMKVSAILNVSEDLLPNDETLGQLEKLGSDDRIFDHISAMSDVHSKKGRKVATGTVAATEHSFLPQINDTAPNCGMRFVKTKLTDETLTPEIIDKLFKELVKTVPTKKYVGTFVPFKLAVEICKSGLKPLREYFGFRIKNEIENTFANGNFFRNENVTDDDIFAAVPKLFIGIGTFRLGILGAAGNHFLDLMKISEIKNEEIAKKFGLFPGQYIFLIHTGSGLMGQYSSYMYTPKKKEHLSQLIILKLGTMFFGKKYRGIAEKLQEFKTKEEFFGYDDNSEEGKMYFTAHKAAANFGFANRAMITHRLDQALEKILGKQAELELLYDTTHISVEKENHNGKGVWVHRNGSVRANGPSRMKEHKLFSETGEPVFIPSSMSTPAYIGVGKDSNDLSFFSAPHGTGRRKISENDAAKNKTELFEKMEKKNVKLYNAQSSGVVLQDSSYYKDVEEVISGMQENEMIDVVAKMEPIAVLMY